MNWIKKRFEGRMGRLEYGSFIAMLFTLGVFIWVNNTPQQAEELQQSGSLFERIFTYVLDVGFIVIGICLALLILAEIAVYSARRLHDMGRSGKQAWLLLVPGYNLYLLGALLLSKGTEGSNRWGAVKKPKRWDVVFQYAMCALWVFLIVRHIVARY